VLTGAVRRSSERSLIDRRAVSGQAPCSGAERRIKVLDEVSTAIPGSEAAGNAEFSKRDSTSSATQGAFAYMPWPFASAAMPG
jgi:hypothetical protein